MSLDTLTSKDAPDNVREAKRMRELGTAPTFGDSIKAYVEKLPLEVRSCGNALNSIFTAIANEDLKEGEEPVTIGERKNLAQSLLDPSSHIWQVNFMVFRIIKHLRRVWRGPFLIRADRDSVEARTYVLKRRNELNQLIVTAFWSTAFLQSFAETGNLLAKNILQIVDRDSQLGIEEKVLKKSNVVQDSLKEVRRRLQRGRLWRNDPWWPEAQASREKLQFTPLKRA